MIPPEWLRGEVAVLGLGKSGTAVATLLAGAGARVYASDAAASPGAEHAAARLAALGVAVGVGTHDLDRIARAALVVASPGIPPTAPPLMRARDAEVPVVGEIEVALRSLPDLRYVAVTGTNGKTTTTALIAHLLRALGLEALAAGNIGIPLADLALHPGPYPWVALEMSSFQLHDTPSIAPAVGVLTNLGPDHLDRYASLEDYYADKARLFANARDGSRWVVNGEDAVARRMAEGVAGAHYHVAVDAPDAEARYDRAAAMLELFGEPLLPRDELPLLGDHNVANALAAALAVAVADDAHRGPEARARIAAGLRSFRALPHRLEPAGEYGGARWINDSKATNVGSTLVALRGMTRPTVVLLGGRHKGESYAPLAEPLRAVARVVLAYGEAAPLIAGDLAPHVRVERFGSSFEEVVARARALAEPGDVVLLSPACSSYDMFSNYEERGTTFKRLAAAGEPE
jgi:UDP-N-acetylmuramoylalanine--D-glutamate ligase